MPAAVSPPPSGSTWPRPSAMGALILLATEVVTETCGKQTADGGEQRSLLHRGWWRFPRGHARKTPSQGALPGQRVLSLQLVPVALG